MLSCMGWNRKRDNSGKIIMATIAGVAAGVVAGMLTAPRSGREIREIISSRTSDTLSKAGKNIAENADKVVEGVKEKAGKK